MPNLTIVQQPDLLSASENPILLKLRTSESSDGAVKAKFAITVATPLDPDDQITFYFRSPQFLSKTFVASSFPTAQNEFFASDIISPTTSGTTSVTVQQIMLNLTEKLRQDAFIARYYDISFINGSIIMTAKFTGSEFTLVSTSTQGFGSTNLVYSNIGGIARSQIVEGRSPISGEDIKNYSLYADVYVNSNKNLVFDDRELIFDMDNVGSLRKPFIKNGLNLVEFDLSNILKNYVSTGLPTIGSGNVLKANGNDGNTPPALNYVVAYGEYAPVVDSIDGLQVNKVQKGTITNKAVLNSAVNYGDDVSDYYQSSSADTVIALTNQPTAKLTHPSIEIDPLYFVYKNFGNQNSVTFENDITYNFYDGSSTVDSFSLNRVNAVALFSDDEFVNGLSDWSVDSVTSSDVDWTAQSGAIFGEPFGIKEYIKANASNATKSAVVYQDIVSVLPPYTQVTLKIRVLNDIINGGNLLGARVYLVGYDGSTWNQIGQALIGLGTVQELTLIGSDANIDQYSLIGFYVETFTGSDADTFEFNVDYAKFEFTTTENTNGVYYYDVSPANFGIDADGFYSAKRVKSYEVKMLANTAEFTVEPQTYRIAYDIAPKGTTLMWQNPLGGYDSFYFSGIREDSINRTSDDFEVVVDKNYPQGFEKNKQYNIEATEDLTLNSGWVKEDHMDWLKEILSSPKVYVVENGVIKYYTVNGFGYTKNNQNNQFNVELDLRKTIENNNITE